jgi:hypothetical protein
MTHEQFDSLALLRAGINQMELTADEGKRVQPDHLKAVGNQLGKILADIASANKPTALLR